MDPRQRNGQRPFEENADKMDLRFFLNETEVRPVVPMSNTPPTQPSHTEAHPSNARRDVRICLCLCTAEANMASREIVTYTIIRLSSLNSLLTMRFKIFRTTRFRTLNLRPVVCSHTQHLRIKVRMQQYTPRSDRQATSLRILI
jgi:hypothetical protein